MTFRRIFWQSIKKIKYLCENEKNTKAIVHGIVKKWGFQVDNGIEPFYVRMYVYMS